jgi:hypothetical protein
LTITKQNISDGKAESFSKYETFKGLFFFWSKYFADLVVDRAIVLMAPMWRRLLGLCSALLLAAAACGGLPASADTSCATASYDIQFQPSEYLPRSFFFAEGQNVTVPRNVALPRIIVRVVDSTGAFSSTENVVINVTADDDSVIFASGTNRATVYHGEAHFTNLAIVSGTTMRLRFMADSTELVRVVSGTVEKYRLPLHGKYIDTGTITVSAEKRNEFQLRFMPTSSYILYDSTPVTFVSGSPLPTFRLQLLSYEYLPYIPGSGNPTVYTVTCNLSAAAANTQLTGTTAVVIMGVATFSGLTITTTLSTLPSMRCTLPLSNYPALTVETGALTAALLSDAVNVAFDDEDVSFLYTEGQTFYAQWGVALPHIQISLRNTLMESSPVLSTAPSTGLIITASCERAKLTGNVAGMVGGVASFDYLTIVTSDLQDPAPYLVIKFTAGTQGGFAGATLWTGIANIAHNVTLATSMRFSTSGFFTSRFRDTQVVINNDLVPQVSVELLTSDNSVDNTTSNLIVQLEATDTALGNVPITATFQQGTATFSKVQFTKDSTLDDTFFVLAVRVTDKTHRLYNQPILTGRINSTNVVSNFNVRFQRYGAGLFHGEGQTASATINQAMPPIVVEIINSGNNIDTQSNSITITATAVGATLSGGYVRVTQGIAVFESLMFVSDVPGDFVLIFTVGNAGSSPVAGKTLTTGTITVYSGSTPSVFPRFAVQGSYFSYEGQSRPVQLGTVIPDIVVELASSSGESPLSSNTTSATLVADVTLSNGDFASAGAVSNIPVIGGRVTATGIIISWGSSPTLSVCFRSTSTTAVDTAAGKCVTTGVLRTTLATFLDPYGSLAIVSAEIVGSAVTIPTGFTANTVALGEVMRIGIGVFNSAGQLSNTAASRVDAFDVEVSTTVAIDGTTRKSINVTSGIAYFDNLVFTDVGTATSQIITFTAVPPSTSSTQTRSGNLLKLDPISTGLILLQSASTQTGTDVVAEVLADYATFDIDRWLVALCKRLNLDSARIVILRLSAGKSADANTGTTFSLDSTSLPPAWVGTRIEMRILPALSTSSDTRSDTQIAQMYVNLQPSCAIGELQLRRNYLLASDDTCDYYIYDDQMASVRSCIQSFGEAGFCQCYVPFFSFMGARCLGLPQLSTLCLNILISDTAANCKQASIQSVCSKLQFPDAPRTAIAASGAFLLLFFVPVFWLWNAGYFHKMNRPSAEHSRIQKMAPVLTDERDYL